MAPALLSLRCASFFVAAHDEVSLQVREGCSLAVRGVEKSKLVAHGVEVLRGHVYAGNVRFEKEGPVGSLSNTLGSLACNALPFARATAAAQ